MAEGLNAVVLKIAVFLNSWVRIPLFSGVVVKFGITVGCHPIDMGSNPVNPGMHGEGGEIIWFILNVSGELNHYMV